MEKRNSQLEHEQPMEQTRSLFARATQVCLPCKNYTNDFRYRAFMFTCVDSNILCFCNKHLQNWPTI